MSNDRMTAARAREIALEKQLGLPPSSGPAKPDAARPGGGPAETPPKGEKPPEDAGDKVPEPPWSGEEGDTAGRVGACSREAEEG